MLQSPIPVGITLSSLPFALVAFQGFLLCAVLWFKKNTNSNLVVANRIFATLLLVFSLMLIEHTMDLAGYFFYMPDATGYIQLLYFLIGPLIYLYIKIQVSPKVRRLKSKDALHLLPLIIALVIMSPYLLSADYNAKLLIYYDRLFPELSDVESDLTFNCEFSSILDWLTCEVRLTLVPDKPQFELFFYSPIILIWLFGWLTQALWISLLIYVVVSLRLLKKHRQLLRQITSNINGLDLSWLQHFTWLLSITIIVFLFFSIQEEIFGNIFEINELLANYIIYGMIGFCVMYIGVRSLQQPHIFSPELSAIAKQLSAENNLVEQNHNMPAKTPMADNETHANKPKYQNSPVTTPLAQDLANSINSHMQTEESYLNPQLTLPELAEKLSITPHVLSQVLNETLKQNFFEFVNSFRVEKAKSLMLNQRSMPVIQVAMDSGFNSKTAFYSAFKKLSGATPRQWCQQQNG